MTTPDPMREALLHYAEGCAVPDGEPCIYSGRFCCKVARAALAAAPQPAPAPADEREALAEVIRHANSAWELTLHCYRWEAIADALIAAGWRRADHAALDAAYRKGQEKMRKRAAAEYVRTADIEESAVDRAIRALPIQGGDDAA